MIWQHGTALPAFSHTKAAELHAYKARRRARGCHAPAVTLRGLGVVEPVAQVSPLDGRAVPVRARLRGAAARRPARAVGGGAGARVRAGLCGTLVARPAVPIPAVGEAGAALGSALATLGIRGGPCTAALLVARPFPVMIALAPAVARPGRAPAGVCQGGRRGRRRALVARGREHGVRGRELGVAPGALGFLARLLARVLVRLAGGCGRGLRGAHGAGQGNGRVALHPHASCAAKWVCRQQL